MTEILGKCLGVPIKINDGMICVGFVDGTTHEMNIEFRGSDPDKLIREVTR